LLEWQTAFTWRLIFGVFFAPQEWFVAQMKENFVVEERTIGAV